MKKISLKNLNLKEVEQLSREQLKNVLGGYTGSTGTSEEGTSGNGHYTIQICDCSCNQGGENGHMGTWNGDPDNCTDGSSKNCKIYDPPFPGMEGSYSCEITVHVVEFA